MYAKWETCNKCSRKVSVVHLSTEYIERNICQDSIYININSHENTSNCAVNSWEKRMWHYSLKKIVDSLRELYKSLNQHWQVSYQACTYKSNLHSSNNLRANWVVKNYIFRVNMVLLFKRSDSSSVYLFIVRRVPKALYSNRHFTYVFQLKKKRKDKEKKKKKSKKLNSHAQLEWQGKKLMGRYQYDDRVDWEWRWYLWENFDAAGATMLCI